ncbi:MAG: hypothetical protein KDG49_07070, partial [Geminicoccaceae bacterium]|nr:hypothetical protein [Geminicoccaceae bacterium]
MMPRIGTFDPVAIATDDALLGDDVGDVVADGAAQLVAVPLAITGAAVRAERVTFGVGAEYGHLLENGPCPAPSQSFQRWLAAYLRIVS